MKHTLKIIGATLCLAFSISAQADGLCGMGQHFCMKDGQAIMIQGKKVHYFCTTSMDGQPEDWQARQAFVLSCSLAGGTVAEGQRNK